MTAEGNPAAKSSLLAAPLEWVTRWALASPMATLALALALAVLALVLTFTRLDYRTSRLDLLNPESDYNRLWIEYIEEFGDDDDAVVVVEGASREQVVPVLQEISTELARNARLFHAVLHEVDLGKIRAKGLHYLPDAELAALDRYLADVSPILHGGWDRLSVGTLANGLLLRLQAAQLGQPESRAAADIETRRLAESLATALDQGARYRSPWPEMPQSFATLSELSSEYLLTKEGRLGFVLLRLARDEGGFARGTMSVDALRDLIAQARVRHPHVSIGLTGLPVMENDEMRASQSSMTWASILSLLGVAVLFVAGFGGVRHALLANLVLLVGMAWSFGYVTLMVGHLNILSVSFTVTLIGIGIDYGIHYVARYLQLRRERWPCREALVETTRSVGPAILTSALSTAVAFFAAGFTSFTGIAELGIIAGGGILLCAAAELLVLPAAIVLFDHKAWGQHVPEPLHVHDWIAPLMRAPGTVLAASIVITLGLATGMGRLWYDHNLLNMQPEGIESVELERRLLADGDQSVWYALSIAGSREELLARKAAFLKLPSVQRTEEIVSLLPGDQSAQRPLIAQIGQRLSVLPERSPPPPVERPEQLGQLFGQLQDALSREPSPANQRAITQLGQARDALRRMPLADCYAALDQLQQQMAGDLLSRMHALRGMANPEPPSLDDLPESLVRRFVGQHGKHLLKIYGRGNIWDMTSLRQFVSDVRQVDPRVTGNPVQAYEASREMKRSFEQSALYALGVILVVLLIDFRSLRWALLAATPLALGVVQTFGLLGHLQIALNPANMIALPLILGIGVDYGVHIVHEYRNQPGRYRMTQATAIAVLIDGLTTTVGFGALLIASHRGLQSMGRVLTLGVTCCLVTSMTMLPALLTWWTRARPDDEPEPATTPATRHAAHGDANPAWPGDRHPADPALPPRAAAPRPREPRHPGV